MKALRVVGLVLIVGCLGAPAMAQYVDVLGYTQVGEPAVGEKSPLEIINKLYSAYGGTFTASGMDYVNSMVTCTRVQDTPLGGMLGIVVPAVAGDSDQLWHDGFVSGSAYARSRFSAANQKFGYFDGATDGTFHELMNVPGNGFNSTILSSLNDLSGMPAFRWARSDGKSAFGTSLNSDNPNGVDRMITYCVTGYNNETSPRWLLFFEDGTDYDVNDLTVEVVAGAPRPLVVPLPGSAAIGLSTLAGLGLLGMIRRFRAA